MQDMYSDITYRSTFQSDTISVIQIFIPATSILNHGVVFKRPRHANRIRLEMNNLHTAEVLCTK